MLWTARGGLEGGQRDGVSWQVGGIAQAGAMMQYRSSDERPSGPSDRDVAIVRS